MRFQVHKHYRHTLGTNIEQERGIVTSRFVGIYLLQVEQWIRILSLISDVIKLWVIVQQEWMYLENIFIGSNLQFGEDAKRFDTADKLYRKIMFETSRNSLVKDACTHPGRYDELKSILNLIEKIQKSSNEYLDRKRQLLDH
ncbi:unnamed protein product [Rotaria sp. Silwood2]|nr:unnamed protein product [Rotaria sp. Silwood2]CAF4604573.1 unnamed protein product [Rotaria sp. Silwood2]